MRNGGVVVIADTTRNDATPQEEAFSDFCGFDFQYGDDAQRNPIYFMDVDENERYGGLIRIDAERMVKSLSEWLRPVYEGITEVEIDGPVSIRPRQESLGFIVSETAGSLCADEWWSSPQQGPMTSRRLRHHLKGPLGPDYLGPFASVRKVGRGFVAAITGIMSSDRMVSRVGGMPSGSGISSGTCTLPRKLRATHSPSAAVSVFS